MSGREQLCPDSVKAIELTSGLMEAASSAVDTQAYTANMTPECGGVLPSTGVSQNHHRDSKANPPEREFAFGCEWLVWAL